jgi:putative thioredoxin
MNTDQQTPAGTTMATFAEDVIQASTQQLVMVDFWADWCGPCRSLTPILEKLADQSQGAVKLVKINTEQEQELAGQFGIRSLPTVFFFRDGKPVDQFMGLQPESAIKEIIDRHSGAGADQGPADLDVARQAYDQGQHDEAKNYVRQLIAVTPDSDEPKLLLVEWLTAEGMFDEAKLVADTLSDEGKESKQCKALEAAIELQQSLAQLPAASELLAAIEEDENNHGARMQLAQRLVAEQDHAAGMEHLLEIIRRDRSFEDDGARKYLITVFGMLGGRGELVTKYRGMLARLLN